MKFGKISSLTSNLFMNDWTNKLRNEINKSSFEASRGRHYNMSKTIGYKVGTLVDIASQKNYCQSYLDSNKIIGDKFDFIQKSMTAVFNADSKNPGSFQKFISSLLVAASPSNAAAVKFSADAFMESLNSSLNSMFDGQYVFSGTNTETPPLKDLKKAVDAIKVVYNKFLNGKASSKITKEDMHKFFTSDKFNAFFKDPEWKNNFSTATTERLKIRISDEGENIEATSTINVFKNVIKSIMIIEVGYDKNLSKDAHNALVDESKKIAVSAGTVNFTDEQMKIGVSQNRIKQINEFYKTRIDILDKFDQKIGGVDQEKAALYEKNLVNSLEISLRITAQLANLSLFNYL